MFREISVSGVLSEDNKWQAGQERGEENVSHSIVTQGSVVFPSSAIASLWDTGIFFPGILGILLLCRSICAVTRFNAVNRLPTYTRFCSEVILTHFHILIKPASLTTVCHSDYEDNVHILYLTLSVI